MNKVSIITLGCKVNLVESEEIAEELEKNGFDVSMGLNPADIYVINTCAVTNEAERKSRNIISKVLKLNANATIYICGCSSENDPERFKKGDFVKGIFGNGDKKEIVKSIIENNQNVKPSGKQKTRVTTKTRADLCVQLGCNNFCTYCIIPYLRGRERSFPLEEVKRQAEKLMSIANEIVITGINLSAYGRDLKDSDGLIDVARIFKGKKNRFRFSSLEVNVVTDEFMKELSTYSNFCPHFHLSLQSGSNNTLKSMNRHYSKEEYLNKVNIIRKYFPNAGITTDIIVGFPTETDSDFQESLEFAKAVNFSEMHIFPYSKRDGTVAASFKNIATNVSERVKKMTTQAKEMQIDFINKNCGQIHEVIVENQKNGYYMAHTKNFILCYIESDKALEPNTYMNVMLTEPFEDGAKAKIV